MDGSLQVAPGITIGQVFAGKYRVDSVIGEGGMGYVIAAHHLQLETKVAIKLLKPELLNNAEAVARFAREARAAVRIVSQHVARVFDVGQLDNGAPYMVMEYLEGGDLSNVVAQRGPLPLAEAVDYLLQACEAIAEAHNAGIVHRDLKPANLFCARRPDGSTTIKVLDFGISKVTGGPSSFNHTKTTAIMGSPIYMSPEQMESTRGVDMRTDIWGLGVILYEIVTGRTPFEGSALPEICLRVATQPPPSIRALRPDVPPGLEAAILRCLEKDRDKRYANVAQLAAGLRDFATPRGRMSVESILRTVPAGTETASANTLPAPAAKPGAQTAESFGSTHPPRGASKQRTLTVVLGLGAVVVIGVLGVLVMRRPSASSSPPTEVLAAASPATATATAIAPATATPTASTIAITTPAEPASAAPVIANPKKGPVPSPAGPRPSTPAKPKSNCDPNFYLDAQGEKHFKPECFR